MHLEKKLYNFKNRVLKSKIRFYNLLSKIYRKNQFSKIAGIGAPSRATTLINYLGLNESILEYIFEIKGSKKIGMYMPGTKIKIVEERDRIRNFQPPVTGEDIMKHFNIKPCKEIGMIKNYIKESILNGKIQNSNETTETMNDDDWEEIDN